MSDFCSASELKHCQVGFAGPSILPDLYSTLENIHRMKLDRSGKHQVDAFAKQDGIRNSDGPPRLIQWGYDQVELYDLGSSRSWKYLGKQPDTFPMPMFLPAANPIGLLASWYMTILIDRLHCSNPE